MTNLAAVNAQVPFPSVLLRLRWLQLRRALPPSGRMLLALAMLAVVWLLCKAVTHDASNGPWIAGGSVLLVWGLHQRRTDHHFLLRHVPRPRLELAMVYGVLVLPALLGLLLATAWASAALLLVVLVFPWSPVARSSGVRAAWRGSGYPHSSSSGRASCKAPIHGA